MQNVLEAIPLEKLTANPANPNRMSKSTFAKLVAHIERTGRYEPIVVRPHPRQSDKYEIINGHHRCEAIRKLGHSAASCIIWDVDQVEVDVLLATLNRLEGRDDVHKRSELVGQLVEQFDIKQLSHLLPESRKQIERLRDLCRQRQVVLQPAESIQPMATAVVFFLTVEQKSVLDEALKKAEEDSDAGLTVAHRRSKELMKIAKVFIVHSDN